jgi:putative transposase
MKFGFIARHRDIWPVAWLCEATGVSRSGFHAWLNRSPSARSRSDEAVSQQVKTSFLASDRTYEARRVWRDLLADGVECGLHRLDRQFAADRPNQKWIADFTCIWTAEGWLYLSAVIELFSRRVVGWSRGAGMTTHWLRTPF